MPITFERVYMTPDKAAEMLSRNVNRNLPAIHAEKFCRIILDGHWIEDGNPIREDKHGKVRDGQSRLRGIVLAGEEKKARGEEPFQAGVWMIIVHGLEPEAQMVMDTGRKRSFAHWLQIQHVTDPHAVQSILTLLYNYESGMLSNRSLYTTRPAVDHGVLWEMYQKREHEVREAINVGKSLRKTMTMHASVGGVGWLIFSKIDPEDALDFYQQLRLETTVDPRTGASLVLRIFKGKLLRRYDQQEQLAFLIKAWNMYRDGRLGDLLIWKPGGKARELFPEPR